MWFRRDLRVEDNTALFEALRRCRTVHCVFVFDKAILASLPRQDRRVEFIRESLVQLDAALRQLSGKPGAGLIVCHAYAHDEVPRLSVQLAVQAVFANHDDEPQALVRDTQVLSTLARIGIAWHSSKDHVVFERREVLTLASKPYSVFTPYKNAWLKKLSDATLATLPMQARAQVLVERPAAQCRDVPSLAELGFETTNLHALKVATGSTGGQALLNDFTTRMDRYHDTRNFPAVKGPSYLSVHLRFGTVSIRSLAAAARQHAIQGEGVATWLAELVWRDFYFQILSNFPHVVDATGLSHSFKPEYDRIEWEDGSQAQQLFAAWCEGRTGYPLVDAAMAQINQTGYMHNRLRMVVASFLVKDLGIDWRWGERYFAQKLIDFDLAANNGGWQWASSSGCDAQPYFRIFNPVSQSEKFDAQAKFIRKYLPQLTELPDRAIHAPWLARPVDLLSANVKLGDNYPMPIVQHDAARLKTLARYAVVKSVK
jgi:deoxyribodipyrimidine photo-lyase